MLVYEISVQHAAVPPSDSTVTVPDSRPTKRVSARMVDDSSTSLSVQSAPGDVGTTTYVPLPPFTPSKGAATTVRAEIFLDAYLLIPGDDAATIDEQLTLEEAVARAASCPRTRVLHLVSADLSGSVPSWARVPVAEALAVTPYKGLTRYLPRSAAQAQLSGATSEGDWE